MPVHADEPVETDSMTPDSMKLYELQQIEVTATRVDRKTPVAYADIGREAISRRNFGSDMPTLLQMTPSVVATSDAGNGIGGTAFRLRGSDASRINVTTNGVPMNDAESHSVYWLSLIHISFGPTICYPHSPDEKVNIASVGKFYEFLVDTLKNAPLK